MGTTNTLDLNNRVGALKKAITENTEDIYAVMGKMGAKNLIPYPYKDITKTVSGITFTDNGDGSVTVSTVSTGATETKTFDISTRFQGETNDIVLKNGTYILSGCPIGGSSSSYRLNATISKNGVSTNIGNDVGEGVTIKANGDDYSETTINIGIGITISSRTIITTPITFKPMLRLASDTDDTYQPYAKTNKELTDEVLTKIPDAPTTDGTYNLSVTVVNGTPAYSWVSTS